MIRPLKICGRTMLFVYYSVLSDSNNKNVWKENTTLLLHGPRELDKASLALSIAEEAAGNGYEVLYVNTANHLFGLNSDARSLYIFTPEFESIDDQSDYADLVFEAIEQAVRTTGIRSFVIDSVSRIAALSFGRNASVAYIMKRLVALQVKCKLSFLVLADDSTKATNNALLALSDNHIAMQKAEDPSQVNKLYDISTPTPVEISGSSPSRQPLLTKSPSTNTFQGSQRQI